MSRWQRRKSRIKRRINCPDKKQLAMTKNNSNSRSLIVTAILGAAAVAYVFFVFMPGQRHVGELRAQLQEKQQFIMQSASVTSAIQQSENELTDVREFAKQWREASPSEAKLAKLFGELTELAGESGVTILHIDPQLAVKLETLRQIPVAIGVEGEFSQIFAFLRRVEGLPGTVWLPSLKLEQERKDSETFRSEISLTVFTDNREFSE
jgi:Tfp pilus assembly protein PilO